LKSVGFNAPLSLGRGVGGEVKENSIIKNKKLKSVGFNAPLCLGRGAGGEVKENSKVKIQKQL
jgi:hypothetical protein